MEIITKLSEEDKILFREGMALRNYHIDWLFGGNVIILLNPELFDKDKNYAHIGSLQLKASITSVPYNVMRFKMSSPDIYAMWKNQEPLSTKKLNSLEGNAVGKNQVAEAFRSGILKYDSRGYYWSRKGNALLLAEEANK